MTMPEIIINTTLAVKPDLEVLQQATNLLMCLEKDELRTKAQQLGIKKSGERTIKRHICQRIAFEEFRILSKEELAKLKRQRLAIKPTTWKSLY